MKKRIGELNGHPIVTGDSNLTTYNEYYYQEVGDKIMLYKRGNSGELEAITFEDSAEPYLLNYSLLNEDESSLEEEIKNILSE